MTRLAKTGGFKSRMLKSFKIGVIHVGGTIIGLISLLWMPWSWRVAWAKFVYKITYVDPKKHPAYMEFIEKSNYKYQMGKRESGMYAHIARERDKSLS